MATEMTPQERRAKRARFMEFRRRVMYLAAEYSTFVLLDPRGY